MHTLRVRAQSNSIISMSWGDHQGDGSWELVEGTRVKDLMLLDISLVEDSYHIHLWSGEVREPRGEVCYGRKGVTAARL